MTDRIRSIACTVLLAVAACACSRGADTPPAESRDVPRSARRGGRGPAGRRHERSDRVVGRRAGGHRLGGRDREARHGDRAVPERHGSRPGRAVRISQRPESAARLELVPRQPGRLQRRAVRAVQDAARPRSQPREPDAPDDCPDLEARGDRPGAGRITGVAVDARSPRRRTQTRSTTWTAWRARQRSASRRCRTASRSRTRDRSNRCRRPRRRSTTAGCSRGARFRTRACSSRSCARPARRRTGSGIGPASAARERWIASSCRARRATSGASWRPGR